MILHWRYPLCLEEEVRQERMIAEKTGHPSLGHPALVHIEVAELGAPAGRSLEWTV